MISNNRDKDIKKRLTFLSLRFGNPVLKVCNVGGVAMLNTFFKPMKRLFIT